MDASAPAAAKLNSGVLQALTPTRATLLPIAIICLAYIISAQLGFAFAFETKQVTAIWPPAGIALAAFLLRGPRIWPGVYLGALISNLLSAESLPTAAGIALGNTIGPLIGAHVLLRYGAFDRTFGRLRDILSFALCGCALAMTITATNGLANLALAGLAPPERWGAIWRLWWVGDAMGALLVAPACLLMFAKTEMRWTRGRVIEFGALCISTGLSASYFFSSALPLAYPVFPFVIWAAIRFTQREVALVVLFISGFAVWQAAQGRGPFGTGSLDLRLGLLMSFMAVLSVTGLALGGMGTERRRAEASLRRGNADLEDRVRARTTELAAMNAALIQSEERFRGAFDVATHGMALVSTAGRWLSVNQAICDIVGYSEAELLATDFQSLTHPDDLNSDLGLVRQLLNGEIQNYQLEKRYFHKDGRTVWILLSVSLVRDEAGMPVHFVSQIKDITARRDAEASLARAHQELAAEMERWEALAQVSRDMIVRYLPDTTMTYVSPASTAALGYEPAELVGRRIQDFLHPDDIARGAKDIARVAKGGADSPSLNMRLRARHKDGGWRSIEGRPRPIFDAETGALKAFYDVMRDVTEQVKMEKAHADALVRAEAASRAKSEFLANMSHELRTPLNSVLGYARLLAQSNDLGERDHRFAKVVEAAGETTLSVVNDVLDAAALEGGKISLNLGRFDLCEMLQEVEALVSLQADAKGLGLDVEFDERISSLEGDRARIRQILLNLASNAIKFTDAGGVTLAATLQSDQGDRQAFRLEVRDTGIGIEPSQLPFVFDRFVQLNPELHNTGTSSGLGLAIVKDLVALMSGEVRVESEPGGGSTFVVLLELRKSEVMLSGPEPATPAPPSVVLVADDLDLNRELVVHILERLGHTIETAADGAEAVAKAATTRFDAIFMDVRMPQMDGLAATRAIRAQGASSQSPIIALTAGVFEDKVAACLAAGMNDYLAKPLNETELLMSLARCTQALPASFRGAVPPALQARFRQRLLEDRDHLHTACGDDDTLALAHRLAGAAGSFGFSTIGDLACALENALTIGAADWDDRRSDLVRAIDATLHDGGV